MEVTPQGKIWLCKSKLTNDYKNSLTFTNATTQLNYFKSISDKSFIDYTYLQKSKDVKRTKIYVDANIDTLINYNYLFYQNIGFSNKTFYCFITGFEYINNDNTGIEIETDVLQTWYFDLTYHRSFIEREHVTNDTVGLHTVPENLETGEYINQEITISEKTNFNIYNGTGVNQYICLAIDNGAFANISINPPAGSRMYNGVFTGFYYVIFPTSQDCQHFISLIQENAYDVINSAFMVPSQLCNTEWSTYGEDEFQYAFVPFSNSAILMKSITLTKPTKLDSNYTPRNKKLLTSPFVYFSIYNNAGATANYYYELFKNGSGGISTNCNFDIYGCINVGCSIKLIPLNYRSVERNTGYNENIENEGLEAPKLPTCGWWNDTYINWLTQNGLNQYVGIGIDTINMISGIATGNVTNISSGALGIFNSVREMQQKALTPSTAKGGANLGDLNYSRKESYSIYKKSIKEENARIIDSYFDMFGYKVNIVKIPQFNSRSNWNYIKTIDCNITGNCPQSDLQIIKQAFDNGITWWHNPITMYDYSQTNSIN